MIHEYRKKTTIKAEQFDGSAEMVNKYHIDEEYPDLGLMKENPIGTLYTLPTNEGNMLLDKGDYVATGIDGEHWVIADNIFKRTYERVK